MACCCHLTVSVWDYVVVVFLVVAQCVFVCFCFLCKRFKPHGLQRSHAVQLKLYLIVGKCIYYNKKCVTVKIHHKRNTIQIQTNTNIYNSKSKQEHPQLQSPDNKIPALFGERQFFFVDCSFCAGVHSCINVFIFMPQIIPHLTLSMAR